MSMGYDAALLPAETAPVAAGAGLGGLLGSVGSMMNPVSAGLGILSTVTGMAGKEKSGIDYAKAGGDYYSGPFNVGSSKTDTLLIVGLVVGLAAILVFSRGKK